MWDQGKQARRARESTGQLDQNNPVEKERSGLVNGN